MISGKVYIFTFTIYILDFFLFPVFTSFFIVLVASGTTHSNPGHSLELFSDFLLLLLLSALIPTNEVTATIFDKDHTKQ